jgi:predicted ArsR family transcriptional regulator
MSDDRLNAVADADLRETLLLARSRAAPFTADEVAVVLGIHRNVARSRLDRLAAAGLLLVDFERRTGRRGPGAGRPAKIYRVAPELSAIEFPPRRYPELVTALLEQVPRAGRKRALRRAGEAFGRELAAVGGLRPLKRTRAGLERMCVAVRSLGFQASLVELRGEEAVIATPTCPLRPLVVEQPEAAEIDRGMWAGLVEKSLRGVRAEDVQCETANCLDDHASCRVTLRLRRQEASSSGEILKR